MRAGRFELLIPRRPDHLGPAREDIGWGEEANRTVEPVVIVILDKRNLQWSEMPGVLALAVNSLIFGWSVGEDLYFVPSNGTVILESSHHGEIIGHFPNIDARRGLLERLARASFE